MFPQELSNVQIEYINQINVNFANKINSIIALGPGIGKTRIACKIIYDIIENDKDNYNILIIHKASNYQNPWLDELDSCNLLYNRTDNNNYELRYKYYHGKDRFNYQIDCKYAFNKSSIILTTYDTLCLDINNQYYDNNFIFDLIIYDELHTIINYKRLTKRSKAIYKLQAKYKIALTATPIQNNTKELGVIFAFLNDRNGFYRLIQLFKGMKNKNNKKSNKKKNDLIDDLLEASSYNCINKNALIYYDEYKSIFDKYSVTLSLPIDGKMYNILEDISDKPLPYQRRFLSHPATIYKKTPSSELPRCTKAEVVKIILQQMEYYEKAIIFSMFIDVLNIYANLCHEMGLNYVIITGNDKGKRLESKQNAFMNGNNIRVLLTTLQKSAEGYNYQQANHVIILEFWWNPQKIIQAMGRIDRKTQKNNIFIYLLCYNYENKMIKYDNIFYDKMVDKLDSSNEYYKYNELINPKSNNDLLPIYRNIPEIQTFTNLDTLEKDVKTFITSFVHNKKIPGNTYDYKGDIHEYTKQLIYSEGNRYLEYINILKTTPWHLANPDIDNYVKWYSSNLLYILKNKAQKYNDIKSDMIDKDYKLERYYVIIYLHTIIHEIQIQYTKTSIKIKYLIAKRKIGKYQLIGTYYNKSNAAIIKELRDKGVNRIRLIIINKKSRTMTESTIYPYFKYTKVGYCYTEIMQYLFKDENTNNEVIKYYDDILSAPSYYKAKRIQEKMKSNQIIDLKYLNHIDKNMPFIECLYRYKLPQRKIICSLNIIKCMLNYIYLLLNENNFNKEGEAFNYIHNISYLIIRNGKELIPTWEYLTQKID